MTWAGSLLALVGMISVWTCLRAPRDQVAVRAVSSVIVVASLVPVMAVAEQSVAISAMIIAVLVCLIARVRTDAVMGMSGSIGSTILLMFLAWSAARIIGQFSTNSVVLQIGMLTTVGALALVVPLLRRADLRVIANVVLVLVIAHTAYAALEQVNAVDTVWQLREKSLETIEDRLNVLIPFLAGRSQSSFGHPIPFGFFACFAALILTHAAFQYRRGRYAIGVCIALVALGLSGTRSAAVALIAAFAAYALANVRWRRLLPFVAGAAIVAIVALLVNLPQLLALDSRFESSVSYIHRTLVAGSWSSLWSQDSWLLWFGWGAGATAELFRSGIVRGAHNLVYFDNAFISLFALSGLLSVLLFCAVLIWSIRGGALAVGVCTFIAVMGFSFDEQLWQLPLIVLALGALLPRSLGVVHRRESAEVPSQESVPMTRRARRAIRV